MLSKLGEPHMDVSYMCKKVKDSLGNDWHLMRFLLTIPLFLKFMQGQVKFHKIWRILYGWRKWSSFNYSHFLEHYIIKQFHNLIMDAKLTNTRKREIQTLQLDFSYRKISYELRKQLIELVINEGSSVYRASKILKINNSTAKAIIRKFRKDGTIYMRKKEMENLCCPQPLRDDPQAQEQAQEAEEQQQCDQEAAPDHNQAPFFYFYAMGLETCYGFPTFSFTNFF